MDSMMSHLPFSCPPDDLPDVRLMSSHSKMTAAADPELVRKCKKSEYRNDFLSPMLMLTDCSAAEKVSENVYMMGNEPTLACYRIQEHVHKSGPMLIDKGVSLSASPKPLSHS